MSGNTPPAAGVEPADAIHAIINTVMIITNQLTAIFLI
jgi:hypothetical protein